MKKLVVLMIVMIVLITSSVGMAQPAFSGNPSKTGDIQFTDIKNHWALDSIAKMTFKKIAFGYEDSTFHPDSPITRLDTAVMLYRLFKHLDDEDRGAKEIKFVDTDTLGKEQQQYIGFVNELGIMVGDAETNTFRPSSAINRAEASVIIVRALGLEQKAETSKDVKLDFKDAQSIPQWAKPYVDLAVETGLIKGYTDKTFRPERSITRAEMTALIDRLDNILQTPEDNREYFGSLLAVGSKILNIRLENGSMKNFKIGENIRLYDGSSPMMTGQLQPGDEIEFITNGKDEIVLAVKNREKPKIKLKWIYGILQEYDTEKGIIKVYPHGSAAEVEVKIMESTLFDTMEEDLELVVTQGAKVIVVGEVKGDEITTLEVKVKM